MRYDAAIIGAGANGLTAAAVLIRAGLTVLVIERAARPGGRLVTDDFHPGFAASVFADRVPAIPPEVMAALELAVPLQIEDPPHDICLRRDARWREFLPRHEPRIATRRWRDCGAPSCRICPAPPGRDRIWRSVR